MPGRTSIMGKRMDRAEAKKAAYRTAVNPFPEGTRLWRYFIAARKHHDSMEARFRDLELVYGPVAPMRAENK